MSSSDSGWTSEMASLSSGDAASEGGDSGDTGFEIAEVDLLEGVLGDKVSTLQSNSQLP